MSIRATAGELPCTACQLPQDDPHLLLKCRKGDHFVSLCSAQKCLRRYLTRKCSICSANLVDATNADKELLLSRCFVNEDNVISQKDPVAKEDVSTEASDSDDTGEFAHEAGIVQRYQQQIDSIEEHLKTLTGKTNKKLRSQCSKDLFELRNAEEFLEAKKILTDPKEAAKMKERKIEQQVIAKARVVEALDSSRLGVVRNAVSNAKKVRLPDCDELRRLHLLLESLEKEDSLIHTLHRLETAACGDLPGLIEEARSYGADEEDLAPALERLFRLMECPPMTSVVPLTARNVTYLKKELHHVAKVTGLNLKIEDEGVLLIECEDVDRRTVAEDIVQIMFHQRDGKEDFQKFCHTDHYTVVDVPENQRDGFHHAKGMMLKTIEEVDCVSIFVDVDSILILGKRTNRSSAKRKIDQMIDTGRNSVAADPDRNRDVAPWEWKCDACTFINSGHESCAVCSSVRRPNAGPPGLNIQPEKSSESTRVFQTLPDVDPDEYFGRSRGNHQEVYRGEPIRYEQPSKNPPPRFDNPPGFERHRPVASPLAQRSASSNPLDLLGAPPGMGGIPSPPRSSVPHRASGRTTTDLRFPPQQSAPRLAPSAHCSEEIRANYPQPDFIRTVNPNANSRPRIRGCADSGSTPPLPKIPPPRSNDKPDIQYRRDKLQVYPPGVPNMLPNDFSNTKNTNYRSVKENVVSPMYHFNLLDVSSGFYCEEDDSCPFQSKVIHSRREPKLHKDTKQAQPANINYVVDSEGDYMCQILQPWPQVGRPRQPREVCVQRGDQVIVVARGCHGRFWNYVRQIQHPFQEGYVPAYCCSGPCKAPLPPVSSMAGCGWYTSSEFVR